MKDQWYSKFFDDQREKDEELKEVINEEENRSTGPRWNDNGYGSRGTGVG